MSIEIAKSKETKSYGVSLWDKEILKYVEDIIKVTDYQILYEEQTMLIGKVIADYSDEDLNDFRKFLKKPKRDAKFFANQKRFYEAFMNNGEKKNILRIQQVCPITIVMPFHQYFFSHHYS